MLIDTRIDVADADMAELEDLLAAHGAPRFHARFRSPTVRAAPQGTAERERSSPSLNGAASAGGARMQHLTQHAAAGR